MVYIWVFKTFKSMVFSLNSWYIRGVPEIYCIDVEFFPGFKNGKPIVVPDQKIWFL